MHWMEITRWLRSRLNYSYSFPTKHTVSKLNIHNTAIIGNLWFAPQLFKSHTWVELDTNAGAENGAADDDGREERESYDEDETEDYSKF